MHFFPSGCCVMPILTLKGSVFFFFFSLMMKTLRLPMGDVRTSFRLATLQGSHCEGIQYDAVCFNGKTLQYTKWMELNSP